MSSFFSQASFVMDPSVYRAGTLFVPKPTDGSGDLNVTRSNDTATRVASNGLIEKVRTNVLLQSNTFTTSWGLSGTTITSGQTGYDGLSDAWLLSKDAAASRYIFQYLSLSGLKTFSVFAKANTLNNIRLYSTTGTSSTADFSLVDGSLLASTSILGSSSEDLGNGWWRFSITTDGTASLFRIYPDPNGTTAGSIYFQNAQAETGDIATDYIPTTTTAVSVGPVANVPRLDYLNSNCPRLLLEPQRTNFVTYSEQFNNTNSWTRSRTSAFGSGSVVNAVTSPDGYTNAEYIQQATGETDGGGIYTGIAYTSGTTYTLSVFAKQGENRYARIGFGIGSGGAGIFCGFDLQDGIAGTPDTGITAKIENYGNGWYRCSITATAQTTGVRNTFVYQSSNLNTFVTTPLQGIYVYGAQLEASATYATSYIPTLGSASTRGSDAASKTGISSLIGQTEGTLFVELSSLTNSVVNEQISLSDGTDANTIKLVIGSVIGGLKAEGKFGSVGQFGITKSTADFVSNKKIAIAYKANDFVFYYNGEQVGVDTGGSVPAMSAFAFSTGNSNFPATGNIKQVLLFKTRLSNSELAKLTSL
jgi:hypothetical protein